MVRTPNPKMLARALGTSHALQRRAQQPGLGEILQRAEERGQEVLVCIAVRENDAGDPVRPASEQELGDRAAGVVGDERHVLQIEPIEELGDQIGDTGRGGPAAIAHRRAVRAERPGPVDPSCGYALGATILLLQTAVDAGSIAPQPVRPLAHILIGAVDEFALYIARAPDRDTARREVEVVLDRLLAGITAPANV